MAVFMSEVTIKNLKSGKVLRVIGAGDGARIGQCSRKDVDDATGRWRLIPTAGVGHQYQIQNVATGMVLEVAGESCEDKARVGLWQDNGGAHQRWRLIPMGEGKHEYALMNVLSNKVVDLWDGSIGDQDCEIVQLGYGHETQQRWVINSCEGGPVSRAVMTMVRNEGIFLPIWLRYYRQFFAEQDIYVLDHDSTDGSTEGHGFTRISVSNPEYGAGWQTNINQRYQHELIDRYDAVLYTDVDEIVAPDPRLGDLGTYIEHFDDDFVTCQGYELLHNKDQEPLLDVAKRVLSQRSTWYPNPLYTKPLLARVPMLWYGGCHNRVDGRTNNDPNLYLIHLHRMDYNICLARHRDRANFPLEQIDRDRGWVTKTVSPTPLNLHTGFFTTAAAPHPSTPNPFPHSGKSSCDNDAIQPRRKELDKCRRCRAKPLSEFELTTFNHDSP